METSNNSKKRFVTVMYYSCIILCILYYSVLIQIVCIIVLIYNTY